MASEIAKRQRKIIREFYSNNDLYCDCFNRAEDLSVKEKESNDNEAQKEKSAIIDSIQELRANISQLKKRAEKSNINVKWSSTITENIQTNKDLSARDCYYQSINQAKLRAVLLDKFISQFDESLAKKRSEDKLRKVFIVAAFIVVIIIACAVVIGLVTKISKANQQSLQATQIDISDHAEGTLVVNTPYGEVTFKRIRGLIPVSDVPNNSDCPSTCNKSFASSRGFWVYEVTIPSGYGIQLSVYGTFGAGSEPMFYMSKNETSTGPNCYLYAYDNGNLEPEVYQSTNPAKIYCEADTGSNQTYDLHIGIPSDWQSSYTFKIILNRLTGLFELLPGTGNFNATETQVVQVMSTTQTKASFQNVVTQEKQWLLSNLPQAITIRRVNGGIPADQVTNPTGLLTGISNSDTYGEYLVKSELKYLTIEVNSAFGYDCVVGTTGQNGVKLEPGKSETFYCREGKTDNPSWSGDSSMVPNMGFNDNSFLELQYVDPEDGYTYTIGNGHYLFSLPNK